MARKRTNHDDGWKLDEPPPPQRRRRMDAVTESVIAQGLRTGGWLSKEYASKADAIRARRRIAHAVKSLDNVTTEARYVDLAGGKVKLSIRITKAE